MSAEATTARSNIHRAIAIGYGIACHALFALGVGTMIAAMLFGMSRSLGRVPAPWSPVANALLLMQFPLIHSLMLTPVGGRVMKRLAPAPISGPLSTTTYALIASIQVLMLFALWTPSGTVWWRAEGPLFWLIVGFYTTAWLLLLEAIRDAGMAVQTGFLGWWAVANDRKPSFPPMPTSGLFGIVRQPIYVAFALTVWTVPVWTPDQVAVALTLTSYCLLGPLLKERRFRQRFGREFDAYAARIPYWLPWSSRARQQQDLSIYDRPEDWWDGRIRWVRTLRNLVPARLGYFDTVVNDWRNKVVLDLGTGGGFMAEAMALRGACVSGIDPSGKAIAVARRHSQAGGLSIDYRTGFGEQLPYPEHTFDIVVCVDVLEHVADLDRVIGEISRVLKPEGLFLFDTINRTLLARLVMIAIAEKVIRLLPRGTHDARLFVRPEELRQKLEACGFTVGPFVGLGPRGLDHRLDVTFGSLPTLAVQYMGTACARVTGLRHDA